VILGVKMNFFDDESAQGAAEYILLFGGIIVIAIVAIVIYRKYFTKSALRASQDINKIRASIKVR
jgi:hypothetical protein